MSEASILDVCCGSRMFWFNKHDTRAVFADIRAEEHTLCDNRRLVISPDLIADFRALPFADDLFPVVVFDPPHLERVGQSAWMGKKYGKKFSLNSYIKSPSDISHWASGGLNSNSCKLIGQYPLFRR